VPESGESLQAENFVFVVPTTDLAESVRFYRDALGLRLVEEWTEPGRGALFAASDLAQVELIEMAGVPLADEPRVALGLQIEGVDDVYLRMRALGARIKAPPRERSWGMYGFGVFDPNGVPINIYEPVGVRGATDEDADRRSTGDEIAAS
jgi:catechol 2,3-dioxygenase-like lactoylglutathione lyase family enzyme